MTGETTTRSTAPAEERHSCARRQAPGPWSTGRNLDTWLVLPNGEHTCSFCGSMPAELFAENSWVQVMLGQGIMPYRHHQSADLMGDEELSQFLGGIKGQIDRTVAGLPSHQSYVERYCSAPK